MARLRLGDLQHYLEVLEVVDVLAEVGGTKPEQRSVAFLWADIEPIPGTGQEVVEAGSTRTRQRFTVRAQWNPGLRLTPRHRLLERMRPGTPDRIFEVEAAVNVDERDRDVEFVVVLSEAEVG